MLWGMPTVKWVSIAIILCLVVLAEIIIVFIILPRLEYKLGDRKERPRPLGIKKFIRRKRKVRIDNPIKDQSYNYRDLVENSDPAIDVSKGRCR